MNQNLAQKLIASHLVEGALVTGGEIGRQQRAQQENDDVTQRVSVRSKDALENARHDLLVRLHSRSDDLAATEELQAVSAALAKLGPDTDDDRARRLRRGGLSFWDRMSARRHARSRRGVER